MAQKPATTRIPRQLRESDVHGKGAAEIGWGSPGDFDRCRAFMRRHNVPGHEIDGACANLHRLATGEWPGPNAHKGHLATAAVISLTAAAGPDTTKMIRWEGPLALVGESTGDRRHFPHNTLTYQSFPQPYRFQRQGSQGHYGAVTVGAIEHAGEQEYPTDGPQKELRGKRVVWGRGYFLDPDIVPEVREAVHQAEHGVGGPSVDLDSYMAVAHKDEMSGETVASMRRGRMRGATQVAVPAFANLRITVMRPKEQGTSDTSAVSDRTLVASLEEFVVNPNGWRGAPIAPREALFNADDAAKRIEAWANGDPDKMARMFLWVNTENGPLLGRRGYRLPWGDIIDNKPYLIYHAVYAGAALLQDGHGGLPNIPDEEKGKLRTVISEIYQKLAQQFDDPSIIAPWDRGDQQVQQASGEPADDEYDNYMQAHTAALEEFVRTNWRHRYVEAKHPRDQRHDKHAGEWIDTPHGPHGQIKVGGKWVYPPKRGEKGYKDPEGSARAIAKRGGGKGTKVAKKAPPHRAERHHAPSAPAAEKKAPAKKAALKRPGTDEHIAALKQMDRRDQKSYLHKLSDDEIDSLVTKTGGTRLEDDTRDDHETEIIRRINKDNGAEEKAQHKDEQVKKRDQVVREVSHGDEKKTVVAKKKPEPEKKPAEKKVPEKKIRERKIPERKAEVSKDDRDELVQRRKELKQIDTMIAESERKGGKGSKRHDELLNERDQLLQDIDALERKIGGGEKKTPEKKAPEVKAPERKTAVAKKVPRQKRSGQEHADAIKEMKSRDEVEAYLKDLTGPELHETLKAQNRKPEGRRVQELRDQIAGDWSVTKTLKKEGGEEKAPERKTAVARKTAAHKVTPAQQRILENLRDGKNTNYDENHPSIKVLEREGYVEKGSSGEGRMAGRHEYQLTQKGRDHLGVKGEERKTPEVKAPEKKTTVVARKTGEHRVTPAQDAKLKQIARGEQGGLHNQNNPSIKVLEREGYIKRTESHKQNPDHGYYELTQKGRDHLGVKGEEKKAPEVKTPERKTVVGKKAPAARKTTEEHIKAIDAMGTREEVDKYLADNKLTNAELRDIVTAQGKKPTSGMTKAQLQELVGRGARLRGYKAAVKETFRKPTDADVKKKATAEERKAAKEAERTKAIAEHVTFLRNTEDRKAAQERLATLPKRDLLEIARQIGIDRVSERDTAVDLRDALDNYVNYNMFNKNIQLRSKTRKLVDDLRAEHAHLLSREPRPQIPGSGGTNPRVLVTRPGHHPAQAHRWWEDLHEDTGPQGIPAQDVLTAQAHPAYDIPEYRVKSGRVFRFNGVSYLIEDGAGGVPPEVMAQRLRKFHESLPPSAVRFQRAYTVLKGASPADKYWQREFNSPKHKAIASAGDGVTRIWQGGWDDKKVPGDEELFGHLRHEFGHNSGKSEHAKALQIDDASDSWRRASEADTGTMADRGLSDVTWDIPSGSFHPETSHDTERGYAHGVSGYGKSSQAEDYAEATFQYLTGPIGVVVRNGQPVPVYFRDIFPHRAELLDQIYPDVARIQKQQIAKRGKIRT